MSRSNPLNPSLNLTEAVRLRLTAEDLKRVELVARAEGHRYLTEFIRTTLLSYVEKQLAKGKKA